MTSFVLTVLDEDHLLLTTEEPLKSCDAEDAKAAIEAWRQAGGALVIAECVVTPMPSRQIVVEIDVEHDHDGPGSEAEVRHERLLADPFASPR